MDAEEKNRVLREGLAAWREQGLLSALGGPARPGRAAVQERKLGRGVSILINLGAVILGAGPLVFFASNWIEFRRAAKIASLFALTLFFYVAGFELTRDGRWSFPTLGLALIFLGCVMFGLDVVLLALILFLGLLGVIAWFGAEVGYSWGAYWLYLGRPFHFIGLGACLLTLAGVRGPRLGPFEAAPRTVVSTHDQVWGAETEQHRVTRLEWRQPHAPRFAPTGVAAVSASTPPAPPATAGSTCWEAVASSSSVLTARCSSASTVFRFGQEHRLRG